MMFYELWNKDPMFTRRNVRLETHRKKLLKLFCTTYSTVQKRRREESWAQPGIET